ncbi:hypothetical protein GALL_78130 [mine drainage metagenome]|uniref:Uncharacterized protein n=1 Tax=mine drainage metagenome TaxID=410659 RepID=A0A1J5T9J7_9ZZZZ
MSVETVISYMNFVTKLAEVIILSDVNESQTPWNTPKLFYVLLYMSIRAGHFTIRYVFKDLVYRTVEITA